MFIIGLSGGIGSGKTVASDHFNSLGVPIIDTDIIAREIVEVGKPTLQILANEFGLNILESDGSLNRSALRETAFSTPARKQRLDSITHPAIRIETVSQIKSCNAPYCIVVVPLLSEDSPFREVMNRILIVTADLETKITRVQQRSGLTRDQILKIISTQLSDQKRLDFADDIIENNSSLAHVYSEVEKLHELYTSLSKSHKER